VSLPLKPHERQDVRRVCWPGVITLAQAQERMDRVSTEAPGTRVLVLEVRPATAIIDDKCADCTEVIFDLVEDSDAA
jgi:hypothetical protein